MMEDVNQISQTMPRKRGKWEVSWKVIKTLFALLTATGTILGLYQWYRYIGSNPHVKFNIIDNQCFTRVAAIPNLESKFTFDGRQVGSLWLSRILLVNDCQRNIIGTPYHDLMSSNINFRVSEEYRVLKVLAEKNDFGAIVDTREDGFSISFSKWRPDQVCLLNIYCEGGRQLENIGPCFEEEDESFAQGKLQIAEYRPFSESLPLIKYMPKWLSFVFFWAGRIIYGVIIVACMWGVFINVHWVRLLKRLKWNRKYLSLVDGILSLNAKEEKNSINIDKLPSSFWVQKGIPRPPRNSEYVKGTKIDYSDLMPMLTLCAVGFMLSLIALSGLIYF